LVARHALDRAAAARLAGLQSLLAEDPLAPTAVRDPQRILEDHLADSLVALDLEAVRSARRAVDIGSGAGLPGIPLAIALPDLNMVLLESAARKCRFLEGAIARCKLQNARVVHSRAESWRAGRGEFDLGLCRAVAPLEVVVEYGAPLLVTGGSLLVWRGGRDLQAEERAARAAHTLGLRPTEVRRVWPYPAVRDRYLHLFLKVTETPAAFPRRPGAAAKRPLGSC
jgi:16S rRNA (guanine527-N7)-methyltransferase